MEQPEEDAAPAEAHLHKVPAEGLKALARAQYTEPPADTLQMLQYYESHLVFTTSDEPGQNGQNGNAMDEAF